MVTIWRSCALPRLMKSYGPAHYRFISCGPLPFPHGGRRAVRWHGHAHQFKGILCLIDLGLDRRFLRSPTCLLCFRNHCRSSIMILPTREELHVDSSIVRRYVRRGANDQNKARDFRNPYPRNYNQRAGGQPIAELRFLAAWGVHPKRAVARVMAVIPPS
jgi:hypothetical protein